MDATGLLPSLPAIARRALAALGLGVGLALAPQAEALAQDDPPGRVGRVASFEGKVFGFDHESGRWVDGERNRPLTGGDRVATAADGRVELRVGSTTLRLGPNGELELLQLDDERMVFQLHAGALALRVRAREVAHEIEVATPEARLRPERAGHYRIERVDGLTYAGSWLGELRIDEPPGLTIAAGERVELWRDARSNELRSAPGSPREDEFSAWAQREDRRDDQRSASPGYVSPEMTGYEDLGAYGRWDQHPEYGPLWYPLTLSVGWAPYRYGRWAWVRPWGWTWVDDAPWGFAPFHYGRWVWWRGRWGWVPGPYVPRPVYAPALVAWVGGPSWSFGIRIGGPAVGWVPLAPREAYVPWYRHTPVYAGRVNRPQPHPGGRPPPYRAPSPVPSPQVPTGPIMYSNAGVPGGVTVVSRDVLVSRQPVGRAAVDLPPDRRRTIVGGEAPPRHGHSVAIETPRPRSNAPLSPTPPTPGVQMVPGGAIPVPPPAARRGDASPPPGVAPAPWGVPGGRESRPMPHPDSRWSGRGNEQPRQDNRAAPPAAQPAHPAGGGSDGGEIVDLRRGRAPLPPAPSTVGPMLGAGAVPVAPATPAPPATPPTAARPPAVPAAPGRMNTPPAQAGAMPQVPSPSAVVPQGPQRSQGPPGPQRPPQRGAAPQRPPPVASVQRQPTPPQARTPLPPAHAAPPPPRSAVPAAPPAPVVQTVPAPPPRVQDPGPGRSQGDERKRIPEHRAPTREREANR